MRSKFKKNKKKSNARVFDFSKPSIANVSIVVALNVSQTFFVNVSKFSIVFIPEITEPFTSKVTEPFVNIHLFNFTKNLIQQFFTNI